MSGRSNDDAEHGMAGCGVRGLVRARLVGVLLAVGWVAGSAPTGVQVVAGAAKAGVQTVGGSWLLAPAAGDRDDAAVVAALRQLDPCALLDAPGVGATGMPELEEPHRCRIGRAPGSDEITVAVGSRQGSPRTNVAPLTLGGAKAYGSGSAFHCGVYVPVSFERIIDFEVQQGTGSTTNACLVAKAFATTAVAKLATPGGARVAGTDPFRQWDVCGLLASALGGAAGNYMLGYNNGIDTCGASDKHPPPKAPFRVTLELAYGPDPDTDPARHTVIKGRPVHVENGVGCDFSWRAGPADQLVRLHALDCDLGARLAESVMTDLASTPPASVAPQWPLVYQPDEQDIPGATGCADYPSGSTQCRPSRAVTLPRDPAELLRAAAADPDVACAFTAASVTKYFASMSSIITNKSCIFVQSSYDTRVTISVEPGGTLNKVDTSGWNEHRDITVAGHPGLYTATHSVTYNIYAVVDGGLVHVALNQRWPRAATFNDGTTATTGPDPGSAALLEPMTADIIATYFS